MSPNKLDRLEQLRADIIDNNVGGQLRQTAKSLVMGEGSLEADVVFIGEAPGKREDETGQPFVGASGRFLDEMLAAAGMSRQDVYITNIVKYRPPNNRDPSPEEKQAFWPYLAEQLQIIDPKVIVTLGRHSMEFFLPEAKISQVHGQAVRQRVKLPGDGEAEWLILPLYHPAAALYNGSLRQTLMDDFRVVNAYI